MWYNGSVESITDATVRDYITHLRGSRWSNHFTNGDIYMRQSTNNDGLWTDAIKIVSEDGRDGQNGVDK